MAFAASGFNHIGGGAKRGNAPQMFTYTTTDTAATVDTAGYFNEVLSLLEIGDVILRVTTSGGALSTVGWHVVVNKSSTAVDVTNTEALTVSDSD